MRKKLIAGNWKMHLLPVGARALVERIRAELDPLAATLAKDREVMVAPPDILIPAVAQALAGSSILLGAQNMHFEDKGAFTGEVAPPMLLAYGVTHVILGHSERRHIFHETDDLINKKVLAAIHHRMTPILCVGETQDEHDSGRALDVVLRQLQRGLEGVADDHITRMAIAYEPVWAIGTGRTATPAQAEAIHGAIRGAILERYGRERADTVRIIYGGSVNDENVDSLVSKPDIDGALVGGASLKADSFARIVRARTR
ncbi:MAG: triose-phosphate isomerase [Candidatus Binatus sp.]|uniref:triose-phosphate isomerase n=1 Tax=Candidatus Binatus sp. TaxID=2811406 RepID=UPI003C80C7E1